MCVGNLPEHAQISKIRAKIPDAIKPEIKNCSTKTQVWKILDQEYGQPEDISREAIDGLMQMQLDAKKDMMKFLQMHQEFAKVKNDLVEVVMINKLSNASVIGSVVSKLPAKVSKT